MAVHRLEYQEYNAITLILSVVTIMSLCAFQLATKHNTILSVLFHSVTRCSKRLFCFDVPISFTDEGSTVIICLCWILRIVIVVVMCFLWQTCVLTSKALNLNYDFYRQQLVNQCTLMQSDCFGASAPYHFFSFWGKPPELCHQDITDQAIIGRYPYVICISWITPDIILYTSSLGISFALSQMIVILSELVVWSGLETTRFHVWSLVVIAASCLFVAVWISCIFIDVFFDFFTSWLGSVLLLSVPSVLLVCRQIGLHLRKIRDSKLKQWKARADKPLDQLNDESATLPTNVVEALDRSVSNRRPLMFDGELEMTPGAAISGKHSFLEGNASPQQIWNQTREHCKVEKKTVRMKADSTTSVARGADGSPAETVGITQKPTPSTKKQT
eukprot:GHVS01108327.1.p1 GENE.GHVS01108327.1~~GHVS01108327.1.p1  ORF type:complete len:387 (+),score=33.19 GHVS01108327.1:154-1314(+)